MRRWKVFSLLVVVLALGALGCGGSSNSGITITISPTAVSVITNTTSQFSSLITGSSNTTVNWTIACAPGVTGNICGSIDTNGLYTAPAFVPSETVSGVLTPEPTVTVTGTSAADTTKTATAVITVITGISISVNPTSATVGTGEHFQFVATVSNPGCNTTLNNTCLNVNWSVPANTTGVGSIDSNGVYTAPTTAPNPSIVTLTATSVADNTVTASVTVTIQTANNPTVASVSPTTAALGSVFQDIYITGTNFISTSVVFVNGVPIASTDVSSQVIRARVPANILAFVPTSGVLSVTVSQQIGTPQSCPDASNCNIVVSSVRPSIVGPGTDSIPQSPSGVLQFNVDGGFYGTANNPSVNATYDGQLRVAAVAASNTARQLSVTIGGGSNSADFGLAGLHQVAIRSNGDPTKYAATNIAVQPDTAANPPSTSASGGAQLPAGTKPSDVAINPATGMAVIANNGSNDVTLIDLTGVSPAATLCTGALGSASTSCPSSGPIGVAAAHLINPSRNIALVVNATAKTVSEIDLDAKSVIWVSQALQDTPAAVGINPVSGRALVAMNAKFYGVLIDLTQTPPVIVGPVTMSTGPNTHIAVEPHLNWALATPGGIGTVSIVDLNRQTTNNIVSISRTTNVVTVTVQASTGSVPQSPLAVQGSPNNDAVQIQGVVGPNNDSSFNGIYEVAAVGPGPSQFTYTQTGATLSDVSAFSPSTGATVNYAEPVATLALPTSVQGVAINPETQTAIFADPSSSGVISFFSLIDQSVTNLTLMNGSGTTSTPDPGAAAAAFNPLTDTAYVVNPNHSTLSVIDPDPTGPTRLPNQGTSFGTGPTPVAVAVDPASNKVVVVNQAATTNAVWVYSLGPSSSIRPLAITESNPKVFVLNSTLTTAPSPAAQTLSILGNGFSNTTVARLDGIALSTTVVSNRSLTAIVPPSLLSSARRFSLDVIDSTGIPSNTTDFTVEQSIDVSSGCASPLPLGVAIDPQQNTAAVSLAGCGELALISLSNGTGRTVAVGANPFGVTVIPRLAEAIVANNGSASASIVDELGATVVNTISTDSGSQGVAADQDTGEVAVANSVANDVTVLNVATGGTNSIPTDQDPIAVGFNYQNHQVGIGAATTGTFDVADGSAAALAKSFPVQLPTSVVYDPVTGDVGNDCGSTSNLVGCFLVDSSTGNSVSIIDPTTSVETSFRVGINPTAIAYNYLTSTLISTNTGSHTVTVADFLARKIRAVLTLPAAPANSTLAQTGSLQFAVDINPLTNLAVIADTANGRVLFIPVPR